MSQPPAPIRVYTDGVFDLFHPGHARVLEQAKKLHTRVHLIVGVHSDEVVQAMKGPTVMTYAERLESVRHCRWTDEVVGDAPWVIDADFIVKHRIDFVAHDGDPYPSGHIADIYAVPKRMGIFVATERTPGISTTDIVARILNNIDLYIARNKAREAPVSP